MRTPLPVQPAFPAEVEVVVDVPRMSFIKRDDAGGIDYISPLPCPFNYGSVPNTRSGDGDREDALVLGRKLRSGTRLKVPVIGRVDFVDAGEADPKWVCSFEPMTRADYRWVTGFFMFYAFSKGILNWLRGKRGPTRYNGVLLR